MEPVAAEHSEGKVEKSSEAEKKEQLSTALSCPDVESSQKDLPSSLVSDSGDTGIPEKSDPEIPEEQKHAKEPESDSSSSPSVPALPTVSDHGSVKALILEPSATGGPIDLIQPRVESVVIEPEPQETSEIVHIPASLTLKLDVVENQSLMVEKKEEVNVKPLETPSNVVENKEEVKVEAVQNKEEAKLETNENLLNVVEKLEELQLGNYSIGVLSGEISTDLAEPHPAEKIEEEHVDDIPPPPPVLFREPSSSDPEAPDSQHSYFQELGGFRVQMSDWVDVNTCTYIYDDSPLSPEGLSRINKEIKALTRALPCEPSGAVYIHIDSSNLSRIKAVISGTEDTPYEHGLYLFDIKLDGSYPNSPPKMTIKTTGNGSLRFNPNLYDSGYVCLSIINTWGGDPEEMWNPSYSTLMQVFLSIQALVMNNDVIQKEPGYEGYATNCAENRDYMTIVKYGNIKYAMIDMISNPPEEFKEIVLKHFSLKKDKILESVQKWMGDLEGIGQGFGDCIVSSHNFPAISALSEVEPKLVFENLFSELKAKLESLPTV